MHFVLAKRLRINQSMDTARVDDDHCAISECCSHRSRHVRTNWFI